MTGTTVQATSISALWVVLDGIGLARALNLKMTISSNASTKHRDQGDDHQQEVVKPRDLLHDRRGRLLEADLPGRRLPQAGHGRCGNQRCQCCCCCDQQISAPASRLRSFDKSLSADLARTDGRQPASRKSPGQLACGSGDARRDFRENPGFSNHNSARLAMRLHIELMRHSAYPTSRLRLSHFGLKWVSFHLSVSA